MISYILQLLEIVKKKITVLIGSLQAAVVSLLAPLIGLLLKNITSFVPGKSLWKMFHTAVKALYSYMDYFP